MKLCFAGRISNQSLCARLKSAKGFLKQNFSNQSLCTRLKSAKGFHTAARQGRQEVQRRNEGSAPPGLPKTFIPMMLHIPPRGWQKSLPA